MDMTVGLYTSLLGITWFCVGWAVALAKATGSYYCQEDAFATVMVIVAIVGVVPVFNMFTAGVMAVWVFGWTLYVVIRKIIG